MNFEISNICSAFAPEGMGTRVTNKEAFIGVLQQALAEYDTSQDRIPGQHFVRLPEAAIALVSCGVGKRTDDPEDYVAREHRGVVGLFLRRELAAIAESVAVVVYTRDAYLADPDVQKDAEEICRISFAATHVIVAVLASAGPKAPVGPERFVKNLAGGNKKYLPESGITLADVIAEAKEVAAYHDTWCTVAD